LKATKLIFIATQDGLRYNDQLIRQMLVADLQKLVQSAPAGFVPEMVSKARHAIAACAAGVHRVHIVNGREEEGLLAEVFSNEGIGTLIYANEYQAIRAAQKKDVRAVHSLIQQGVQNDELVKRTRTELEKIIGDYFVFEVDRNPVACVALHMYPDQNMAEVASVFVDERYENQGIGTKLIRYAEEEARRRGLAKIFALSTQAIGYFVQKGYALGSPDDLPPPRREKYEQHGRKSQVLVKPLG
jgi:amino-acid N-acetyltransferase